MERQKQLFLAQPDVTRIVSSIMAVRPHPQGAAVAVAENIVRPAGGGEPRDHGLAGHPGELSHKILGAEKLEGFTWVIVPVEATALSPGNAFAVELDSDHRDRRRRLHTAVHLAIRATQNHLGNARILEAEIDEDARTALVAFQFYRPLANGDAAAIDRAMRSQVLSPRPVVISVAKSVEHAEKSFGSLFRLSDRHALSGRVRLVCIENYDVNPCSGLHHPSTDIGPYELNEEVYGKEPCQFAIRIALTKVWTYWLGVD